MSTQQGDRPPMQAEDRHRAIIELVAQRGTVTLRDLAETLGVAAVTIRVDVRELARRGLVGRIHGGATRVLSPGTQREAHGGSAVDSHSINTSASHTVVAGTMGAAHPAYTLGVVVPHASYYYPTVVSGARAAAEALGARLVLGVSQNDLEEERAQVARLLDSGVDGLILATQQDPQHSPETQEWLRSIPVPVVLAERRAGREAGRVEHVASDHEQGAFEAVQHLAGLGHRSIGLLAFATITAPRLRTGYEAALAALDLQQPSAEIPTELRDDSHQEIEAVADVIAEAVRSGELDALIVHHDVAALPLVSRLRQSGIRVPEDLAVMAYDDELAALCDPPLTAVAPPRAEVGTTAVTLLVERLKDPDRPLHQLLLRPRLRVRGSAGESSSSATP